MYQEISAHDDVEDAGHQEFDELRAVHHPLSPGGTETVPGDANVAVPHPDPALAQQTTPWWCHRLGAGLRGVKLGSGLLLHLLLLVLLLHGLVERVVRVAGLELLVLEGDALLWVGRRRLVPELLAKICLN